MVSDVDKSRQSCTDVNTSSHGCRCVFKTFHVAALMSTVYEEQKDEDGFLYVQYSGESTFG